MVEAEFGLELLILLLNRPALVREADEPGRVAVAGKLIRKYLMRGVSPISCSHKSQTAGATRRCRHSVAGVTRIATNRAAQGRWVPLRQDTRRQRDAGTLSARSRTFTAVVVGSTSVSCDRGRPVGPVGGMCTAGAPRKTVIWREMPNVYGSRH